MALDVNAGVVYNSNPDPNETEPPLMRKMIELVQGLVDVPLCIDSSVPAALAVLSFVADEPFGYGRILRDADRQVVGIREQRDATPAEAEIREVNSGVIAADAGRLRGWLERVGNANSQGEYYLTDCIELAVADDAAVEALICDDPEELMGANDMAQLARLERALQQRRRAALLNAGVRMPAPETALPLRM